jgi:hypothetical protein
VLLAVQAFLVYQYFPHFLYLQEVQEYQEFPSALVSL